MPKVIQLVEGESTLAKLYSEAREELLAEDLPGILLFYFGVYKHNDNIVSTLLETLLSFYDFCCVLTTTFRLMDSTKYSFW